MKRILNHPPTLIFYCLLFLVTIAGCSPTLTTEIASTPVQSPTIEPTPEPTFTQTQPTPTDTALPPTPTSTSTKTSTPTSTSEPASLLVNQNAACRTGPGEIYDIRAYISEGDAPLLVGHIQDNSWWNIEEPNFKATCWVFTDNVSVQGDLDKIPVMTPEPTPTIEPSPTPKQKGMKIYMVALGTGGPFGCGDGLVYFYSGKLRTGDVEKDTKQRCMLSLKQNPSSLVITIIQFTMPTWL